MDRDFWLRAWADGRTGFHSDEVHGTLIAQGDTFLAGGPHRVLVPLCGKSLDLVWLRDRGHEVVGVEIVPQALFAFCESQGLTPVREDLPHGFALHTPGLTLVCADFFALDPVEVGPFDRIWDRAALVALEPERRPAYSLQEQRLLAPGGEVLLEAFEYDQSLMRGPPWSVPREQVEALYAPLRPALVSCDDVAGRVKFKGHNEFLVHAWRMGGPEGVRPSE